jgi:hypothetical protein
MQFEESMPKTQLSPRLQEIRDTLFFDCAKNESIKTPSRHSRLCRVPFFFSDRHGSGRKANHLGRHCWSSCIC